SYLRECVSDTDSRRRTKDGRRQELGGKPSITICVPEITDFMSLPAITMESGTLMAQHWRSPSHPLGTRRVGSYLYRWASSLSWYGCFTRCACEESPKRSVLASTND